MVIPTLFAYAVMFIRALFTVPAFPVVPGQELLASIGVCSFFLFTRLLDRHGPRRPPSCMFKLLLLLRASADSQLAAGEYRKDRERNYNERHTFLV